MGKALKVILLSLMLVSILSLPLTIGCNEAEELTQEEMEQMLADAVAANNSVDSYKMTIDMEMSMDMEGGGEEGTMDMDVTAEGALDQRNMEMYMDMEMVIGMDMGGEQESEEMSMEMYLVDDYIYMKTDMLGMDEGWMKMPADDVDMGDMGMDMAQQQLEPLESPGELKFLGCEKVRGSECYVIEFAPDMETVMELLEAQGLTDMGLSLEEADMVSDLFDELAYKCWVDKETRYLMKMSADILMEMSGDDFEELAGESGSMTIGMDMDMEMYDYNEPANVTVPDEALDAEDMSDYMF